MTDSPELAAIRDRDDDWILPSPDTGLSEELETALIDRRTLLRMLDEARAELATLLEQGAQTNIAAGRKVVEAMKERDALAAQLKVMDEGYAALRLRTDAAEARVQALQAGHRQIVDLYLANVGTMLSGEVCNKMSAISHGLLKPTQSTPATQPETDSAQVKP